MAETHFYGGQAVIEGVMMRGRDVFATAVRRLDGSVVVDKQKVPHFLEGWRLAKIPLIRGTFVLLETLTLGLRSLQFSGNVAIQDQIDAEAEKPSEEDEASGEPRRPWVFAIVLAALGAALIAFLAPRLAPRVAAWLPFFDTANEALLPTRIGVGVVLVVLVAMLLVRDPGKAKASGPETLSDSAMWMAMAPAFAIGIGLFVLLPSWLTDLFKLEGGYRMAVVNNLIEGAIRLTAILGYIAAVSLIGQIRRVFQYHGAEHKVINTLEIEGAVLEEAAAEHSPYHPRCGTAFLLLFIVLKIIIGCFFGWPIWYARLALRLAMVPVVAALAYEATRLAGRFRHSPVVRALSGPGMLLQRMTTREPESPMIQVAIYALAAVAPEVSLPAGWPAPQELRPHTRDAAESDEGGEE